jgi:hypothetical protein
MKDKHPISEKWAKEMNGKLNVVENERTKKYMKSW